MRAWNHISTWHGKRHFDKDILSLWAKDFLIEGVLSCGRFLHQRRSGTSRVSKYVPLCWNVPVLQVPSAITSAAPKGLLVKRFTKMKCLCWNVSCQNVRCWNVPKPSLDPSDKVNINNLSDLIGNLETSMSIITSTSFLTMLASNTSKACICVSIFVCIDANVHSL